MAPPCKPSYTEPRKNIACRIHPHFQKVERPLKILFIDFQALEIHHTGIRANLTQEAGALDIIRKGKHYLYTHAFKAWEFCFVCLHNSRRQDIKRVRGKLFLLFLG